MKSKENLIIDTESKFRNKCMFFSDIVKIADKFNRFMTFINIFYTRSITVMVLFLYALFIFCSFIRYNLEEMGKNLKERAKRNWREFSDSNRPGNKRLVDNKGSPYLLR